jgi:hypothetical protein
MTFAVVGVEVKFAVADLLASIVIAQAPVPVQAPLHPVKVEFASAVAVKLTTVPLAYVAEQVAPQLIPAGELVTVPVPVPVRLTVRVLCEVVKVAVTLWLAFIVTVQVFPEVESQPLQPVKVEFTSAFAVRVTVVPLL